MFSCDGKAELLQSSVSHDPSEIILICDPGPQTSHKPHGYICNNSQKYIVWIKLSFLYAKNH